MAIKDLDTPHGAQFAPGAAAGADVMDHDREMLAAFRGEVLNFSKELFMGTLHRKHNRALTSEYFCKVAQLACLRHPNVLAFFGAVSRGDKVSCLPSSPLFFSSLTVPHHPRFARLSPSPSPLSCFAPSPLLAIKA